MGNVNLRVVADDFDISGNNDLMVHDEALRLRARSWVDNSVACIAGMFTDTSQLNSVLDDLGADNMMIARELVYGGNWICDRTIFDKTNKKFADAALTTKSSTAFFTVSPLSSQVSQNEFSIRFAIRFANVTQNGTIMSEYVGINGLKRWRLHWNGSLLFLTYASNGTNVEATTGALSLSNDTWYEIQLTYSASNTRARVQIKRMSDNAEIGQNEITNAKVMPTSDIYGGNQLNVGGYVLASSSGGYRSQNINADVLFDYIFMFNSELAADFTVQSSAPSIYASQSASATVTLDGSSTGTTWDMSTLDVDDSTLWASGVGNDGWEIRYEASDNATPGTYSSWMTLTALKAEADPTKRYLHLEIRCNASDMTSFYPLRYMTITANVSIAVTSAAPAFDSVANDGNGSSITLTITPPTEAGYVATYIYYRRIGAAAWSSGGTYVGSGGVAGTKQITGLTDGARYEIVLYASFGTNIYSVPSITRRVLVSSYTFISAARDVADLLEDDGIGTFGTDIFVDQEPDSPDTVITVYNTPGEAPQLATGLTAAALVMNDSVMIHVRGRASAYNATQDLAQDIMNALHGRAGDVINNSTIVGIVATSGIGSLGRDEPKNRPKFSMNFKVMRTNT